MRLVESHELLREGRDSLDVLRVTSAGQHRDLLDEYAAASRLVSVEAVDVEAQPALARQYDVQEYGTSVVEYRGRFELLRGAREQDFTNALARWREGDCGVTWWIQLTAGFRP